MLSLQEQEHSWVTNCTHRALSYETRTHKLSLKKQWTLWALWVLSYWVSMSTPRLSLELRNKSAHGALALWLIQLLATKQVPYKLSLEKHEHSWVTNCTHSAFSYETRTLQAISWETRALIEYLLSYETSAPVATKQEPYKLSLQKQEHSRVTNCTHRALSYETSAPVATKKEPS